MNSVPLFVQLIDAPDELISRLPVDQQLADLQHKYTGRDFKMNNWTKLLSILDELFAKNGKQRSRISKKLQGFDNKTGEHVIRIEYRVKLNNESVNLIKKANDQIASG